MYKHILVPLDGSELAECAIPHVESIACGCSAMTVTFIRVVEPYLGIYSDDISMTDIDSQQYVDSGINNTEKYLKQLVDRVKLDGVEIRTEVSVGIAYERIVEFANKNEVDLIIIATHGRSGISRWVWGSVADRILRSACVPVFMVRAPGCVPGI